MVDNYACENTENEKRRGELALGKLVWMDDKSVPSIYQVGISLFFGLGPGGTRVFPFPAGGH